jgi:DNA polymerase-1
MATKSFYIIDGHAQIYRAYFAPFRDLTSPTGEPTRATFVFTQMLLNLVEQRKPDYLAMVIDAAGDEGVFRKQIDPNYKATRKPRPDDFGPQEARILQICRDAGVPIFFVPAYEADDVLATMAKRLGGQGYETFLVSKDKDLRQVLDDHTRMYDVHTGDVTDAANMEAKLGYTPAEAIDVQTLMGDAIDNVPGVPGVGEKTAVKLVKKYGSAAAVFDHLDELTPKLREGFVAFREKMDITRRLVTLHTDVQVDFDPDACKFTGLNTDALRSHLTHLGFTTLLKRLDGVPSAPVGPRASGGLLPQFQTDLFGQPMKEPKTRPPTEIAAVDDSVAPPDGPVCETAADCHYHLVATDEQFAHFLSLLRQQKRFAFDTETDDLGAMNSNLVGMSFSWAKGEGYYVPVKGPEGQAHQTLDSVLAAIKPILEDATVQKVGHNIKYDLLVMRNVGVQVAGVAVDSMVSAFLLDASRMQYGIDRLALDLINFRKVATEELIGKGKNQTTMDKVDLPKIAGYASEDADISLRLANLLDDRLAEYPDLRKLSDDLETPLIDVLAEMEFNGVAVDSAVLKEQSGVLGARIDELRAKIMAAAGCEFNPDSPKQLADTLFAKLGLPPGKKTKTGYSTDVFVLEKLAEKHPVPKLILDYRTLQKLKNTYLDNLTQEINPRTGRIHGHFNQAGAGTGRLSMSDPNLQNIPIRTDEGRRIRLAFVPGDRERNVLLTVDYSQIELRVLAHFTREPALLKAFADDEDIHRAVAAEVFGVSPADVTREQRGYAKTINFGIIYGVSAFGLANRIEGLNTRGAQELIDLYNKRFPGIEQFSADAIQTARDKGYVETILGRRRPITEINSSIIASRKGAERAAGNTIIQGSAADLIKVAMVRLHRRMRAENMQSKLLLQVHDELVFETPKDVVEAEADVIKAEMAAAMTLAVPLKAEAGWGPNWADAK